MSEYEQRHNNPPTGHTPGLSEREIEEILSSSGVINGEVTNGVKLSLAIADIIVKNNRLLLDAIQAGNFNGTPLQDPVSGPHQTAQPGRMWEAGEAPNAGIQNPQS